MWILLSALLFVGETTPLGCASAHPDDLSWDGYSITNFLCREHDDEELWNSWCEDGLAVADLDDLNSQPSAITFRPAEEQRWTEEDCSLQEEGPERGGVEKSTETSRSRHVSTADNHAVCLGLKKNDEVNVRRAKLIKALSLNTVHFSNIAEKHYKKSIFQKDILQLICDGFDIRRTEKQGYYCLGKSSEAPMPSENVAVAMFKLLEREKLSLFEITFRLYMQGYRAYTPGFYANTERAFIIGGVFPHNVKFTLKTGDDLYSIAKKVWEKVHEMSVEEFNTYMDGPHKEYKEVLDKKDFKPVFVRLRDLKKRGFLRMLQNRMAAMSKNGPSVDADQSEEGQCDSASHDVLPCGRQEDLTEHNFANEGGQHEGAHSHQQESPVCEETGADTSNPAYVAQNNHQNPRTIFSGLRKNASIEARRVRLAQYLMKGGVIRFYDIKYKLYAKGSFEKDILQLMHIGFDIRKTESEHYYCLGPADKTFMPFEHVAVAMFNILKNGPLSQFELFFQLYSKGYRSYTTGFLLNMERALIVDGVHPYTRYVTSGPGVDSCVSAKKIWRKAQGLPFSQFELYLKNVEPKHARSLQKNNFLQAITHLRNLHREGTLHDLREMKMLMAKCEKSVGFNQGYVACDEENDLGSYTHGLLQEGVYTQEAIEYDAYAHQHLWRIKNDKPAGCDSHPMYDMEPEPHAAIQENVLDAADRDNCFSQEGFFEGWREIDLNALLEQYEVEIDFSQKGVNDEEPCCHQGSFAERKEMTLDSLDLDDTQQSGSTSDDVEQEDISDTEGHAPQETFEEESKMELEPLGQDAKEDSLAGDTQQSGSTSDDAAQEDISDTEGDAPQETFEDSPTSRELSPKYMPLISRKERILMRLKEGGLCFSDVKDTEYSGERKSHFQEDILQAMHNRADIRETGDGRYCCVGQLNEVPEPSENVAIAMFKLLSQNAMMLFDLSFQLYAKGYRVYPPTYFDHLEVALAVGDVHPCRLQTRARKSVNSCEELREVWKKVEKLSLGAFYKYLQNTPEVHADILQKTRNRQVLLTLWKMRNEGALSQLENAYANLFEDSAKYKKNQYVISDKRCHRKQQIMNILSANINQEIYLADLLQMVNLPKKQSIAQLFRVILSLCDFPIIYDKERRTVKLLDQDIPEEAPQKNTNLLTMVYDLTTEWRDISQDELAYYAHRRGHWPEGFLHGGREGFDICVRRYREFLAILGCIDVRSCAQKSWSDINRQHDIWEIVKKEGVIKNTSHYKKACPDTTKEDLKTITKVKEFVESPEFKIFLVHIQDIVKTDETTLERAQIVESRLRQGSMQELCLWRFCAKNFGIKEDKDMWAIVGSLTEKKEGGRVIYDHKTRMFSWDNESCVPKPSNDTLVAEVFALVQNSYMPETVLCYMLKQKGFQYVRVECVRDIIEGLSVFGLYPPGTVVCQQVWDAINLILTPDVNAETNILDESYSTNAWNVAKRVVEWVHNGSFHKLWQAYEEVGDDAPPSKRSKLDMKFYSPDDIIYHEIPRLSAILHDEKSLEDDAIECDVIESLPRYKEEQKVNRLADVLEVLRHYNQGPLDIKYLAEKAQENVPINKRQNPCTIMRAVLTLHSLGVPIVYDKDAQTVQLLNRKPPEAQKREGTNLLTMVYDLTLKYGGKLCEEEFLYYAHCDGHFCKEKKASFHERINKHKEFLALKGHIKVNDCEKKHRDEVGRRKIIWRLVTKGNVKLNLDTCRGICADITQQDIDAVRKAKDFQETTDFIVFENYVKKLCS